MSRTPTSRSRPPLRWVGASRLAFVAALALAACGQPEAPAPAPADTSASHADAAPDPRVVEIIAAAKKRLAADRALISNRPGHERALERQLVQREGSGMARRILKGAPDAAARISLEDKMRAAATEAAVVLERATPGVPPPPAPVPAEHRGLGAYAYTREQLFATLPYEVVLAADQAGVGRWVEALDRADAMPFVSKIEYLESRATLALGFLFELPVTPPRHLIAPLTPAELAAAAGVELPPDAALAAERATLDALLAEHEALRPELERTLEVLGRSHLEAARFRYYAALADRVDEVLGREHHHREPKP